MDPIPAGAENLFLTQALEIVELVLGQGIRHVDLVIRADTAEAKMEMRVLGSINQPRVHVEALAREVVSFEIADFAQSFWRRATDDIGAAVGDASVRALLGRAWRAGARVGAKLDRGTALAPNIAASVQWARVQL